MEGPTQPYRRQVYIEEGSLSLRYMPMKKCPVCGASVKEENLSRHLEDKHPRAKVEGMKEIRAASEKASRKPTSKNSKKAAEKPAFPWKDDLGRAGTLVTLAGLAWFALALAFPTPVGLIVPASPHLVGLVVVGVALFAAAWVLGAGVFSRSAVKVAAIGLAAGIVLAGVSAFAAIQAGAPNLSSSTSVQPGGWTKAANPAWTSGGKVVFFYYGSAACPFCAASSWAIYGALQRFGALGGVTFTTSLAVGEQYNSVPEVELAHATLTSTYLSLDVKAGDDNTRISAPALTIEEQAYVNKYDVTNGQVGGIPFYVVGGIYYHKGAVLEPSLYFPSGPSGAPLNPQQVQDAIASGTGSVYTAVHQAQEYVEAFLAKACRAAGITPPPAVTNDPSVAAIIAQIT